MTTMRALSDQVQAEIVQADIRGLIVTKNAGGNTLDISAGACYDPSSNKIISYAGTTALSAGSLGASQWNQVYIYDNAGTATIEVVNNAAPPSTTYAGSARQGGTNSNRRWIGSFLTTSGSAIYAQDVKEIGAGQIEISWLSSPYSAPFRVLSAGSSTTFAAQTLVSVIPRYVAVEGYFGLQGTFVTTAIDDVIGKLSIDGTVSSSTLRGYVYATNVGPYSNVWSPIEPSTPQIYYAVGAGSVGSGPRLAIDVYGYKAVR